MEDPRIHELIAQVNAGIVFSCYEVVDLGSPPR